MPTDWIETTVNRTLRGSISPRSSHARYTRNQCDAMDRKGRVGNLTSGVLDRTKRTATAPCTRVEGTKAVDMDTKARRRAMKSFIVDE